MSSSLDGTDSILTAASAHMIPNYNPPPMVLARGDGCRAWDTDGHEYLDLTGGIGVNVLGHAHPKVVGAIAEQAARLCHSSNMYYNRPHVRLCAKLCEISFGSRVYLCNSGTEANEAAIKLVRRTFHDRGQDRCELVAAYGGFHGRTLGALSITGKEAYRKGFGPLIPGVRQVPYGDVAALRKAVGPDTAAVILEPVLGNAGVILPPEGYLKAARSLCDESGALLVFDEVQTGIGRTGAWFAHEHAGVVPDVMTVAKALGGGLPLGALITTHALAQAFQPGVHGSTFGGNPVACAAGLATIAVIEQQELLSKATAWGRRFMQQLREHIGPSTGVTEVRGVGMLIGVECSKPAGAVRSACRRRGMLVSGAGANVLRLFPPLTCTEEELDQAVRILDAALRETPEEKQPSS